MILTNLLGTIISFFVNNISSNCGNTSHGKNFGNDINWVSKPTQNFNIKGNFSNPQKQLLHSKSHTSYFPKTYMQNYFNAWYGAYINICVILRGLCHALHQNWNPWLRFWLYLASETNSAGWSTIQHQNEWNSKTWCIPISCVKKTYIFWHKILYN